MSGIRPDDFPQHAAEVNQRVPGTKAKKAAELANRQMKEGKSFQKMKPKPVLMRWTGVQDEGKSKLGSGARVQGHKQAESFLFFQICIILSSKHEVIQLVSPQSMWKVRVGKDIIQVLIVWKYKN